MAPATLLNVTDVLAPLMLLPRIEAAIAEANDAIAAVSLGARRHAARVGNQILTKAAHSTANLDPNPDLGIAAAVIESSEQLPRLDVAPLQALAKLHAVVGVSEPAEERGRPRPDFTQHDRLNDLASVAASQSPAVLVGAILHAEILAMAPFQTSNGLVARALFRSVMVQRGIDPLICVEIGLGDFGFQAIATGLEAYQRGTSDGVSTWVELNARAVTFGAKALAEAINSK